MKSGLMLNVTKLPSFSELIFNGIYTRFFTNILIKVAEMKRCEILCVQLKDTANIPKKNRDNEIYDHSKCLLPAVHH